VLSFEDEKRASLKSLLGILIPTKDREIELGELLKSISRGFSYPDLVVIVSSGRDISWVIKPYSKLLRIKHVHLDESGQILQKMYGINLIKDECEWVWFVDDDVIFLDDSIQNAKQILKICKRGELKGIGPKVISLNSGMIVDASSQPRRQFRRLTRIFSRPGKVMPSGRNVSYMHWPSEMETEWLSGISIWRNEVLPLYSFEFLKAAYSIYEDVIFSFQVSKVGKLLYSPHISVLRPRYDSSVNSKKARYFQVYWQLFFVMVNKDLSIFNFLSLQAVILLKKLFMFGLGFGDLSSIKAQWSYLVDCCGIVLIQTDPIDMLAERFGEDAKYLGRKNEGF